MQYIYVIGSKGFGNYGGYETFVDKLTEYHSTSKNIKYYVACKSNEDSTFSYHNAIGFNVKVPDIGPAQAIYYDVKALRWCIERIKLDNIEHPIIYILACRIGPFIKHFEEKIYKLGGKVYVNPDGHEWMRGKWPLLVKKYWKFSERLMVKHSDLLICDSKNIERYIHDEYGQYHPQTTFIAYGSDIMPSPSSDTDERYVSWLKEKELYPHGYYLIVGRFVPENNFEVMIREFMGAKTKRDLVIIATENERFLRKLEKKLHFKLDPRIKFVGTVYDKELLKKIRENAYAYFHGHTVGGTNPSLIEALGSTDLNLLVDVGFNREVAENTALYWKKEEGDLTAMIDKVDIMTEKEIKALGDRAKKRVADKYTWEKIAGQYEELFLKKRKSLVAL